MKRSILACQSPRSCFILNNSQNSKDFKFTVIKKKKKEIMPIGEAATWEWLVFQREHMTFQHSKFQQQSIKTVVIDTRVSCAADWSSFTTQTKAS